MRIHKITGFLVLFVSLMWLFPHDIFAAASLSFSPISGSFASGSTIKVNVYANSGGEAANAVQANIVYPADKLQYISISTSGSALTIFAEKYASGNVVRIGGGTPSPGFTGNKLIATVSFKVLSDSGNATLTFADDSALLRDSDNANILSGKGTATYTLGKASTSPLITSGASPTKTQTITQANQLVVSAVAVENTTTNSAVITWKTDMKSDSTIEYGTTLEYEFTKNDKEALLDHRIVLDELLAAGTTYHFRVRSRDGGKEGQSEDMTFKTKGYTAIIHVANANGKPVAGAHVTIYSDAQEGVTDSNGEVMFTNVAAGKHGLIIKKNNQTVISEVDVVEGSSNSRVDVLLNQPENLLASLGATNVLYIFLGFILLLTIGILLYYVLAQKKHAEGSL